MVCRRRSDSWWEVGGSTFNGKWEDWDSEITNRQRQKELYGLNLSSHSIAKIKLNKANI